MSGCAVTHSVTPVRIALLAPFEGRYREVGYNALYAARLALADEGDVAIELMAVDDGGTVDSAASRGKALMLDPTVRAVIALGYDSADAATQNALDSVPMLIVGDWSTRPMRQGVYVLASPQIDSRITAPPHVSVTDAANLDGPVVGGDVFGLAQFPMLRAQLDGVTVASSGSLPGADFTARFRNNDPFAPQPGLLALPTYDATRLIAQAMLGGAQSRTALIDATDAANYVGLSGDLHFVGGYWADAPIHTYRFDEIGELRAVDDVVK
jgi:ABC-type branched-subunit amino acid transport system substrate-binding protein